MLFGDDGTFSIGVRYSGSVKLVDVTGSMTVQILKDKLKNEAFMNVPRSTSHDKMFLQLGEKGFTDECATLESLEVRPGVELKFSFKRTRGGKHDRQSSQDHDEAYKTIKRMGAAGKDTTKPFLGFMRRGIIDQLRAIREVLQTKVRPPPEPPELEDEEGIVPLTSNHLQWLEQAQEALNENLMPDASTQASSSIVPAAASSSTVPDDAVSSDSNSDLEVAIAEEPDDSAGPETTNQPGLSRELASRFVASKDITPGSSGASSVTFSYQPHNAVTSAAEHVSRPMSTKKLKKTYGVGLKLVEAVGWVPGGGLGSSRAATSLETPLKSLTQLDQLTAKSCFSLDTYVQDHRTIGGSQALVAEADDVKYPVRAQTERDVRPYPCGKCSETKWPAYRQKEHWGKSGDWIHTKWVCSDCAQTTPICMNCQVTTWNGYNVPTQESGKWLCAKCWSDADTERHHKWGPWFECRKRYHPQVLSVMPHDVRPSTELHSYEWKADQVREGNPKKWSYVKEYSVGAPGWKRMNWEGEIPSEDLCSAEVDQNFLLNFLKTRPYMLPQCANSQPTRCCDTLFVQAVDKGDGWQYYGMKFHSVQKTIPERRLKAGWLRAFHASRMPCVHSIVCNGLKEGPDMKQNCPGVYHFDRLMRGNSYHRYQLFDDGTAYCVVWYILVDPEKTLRIPEQSKKKPTKSLERKKDGDQWVTQESGVMILGCYTRGYTMSQIKEFCNNPERAGDAVECLVTQWQPQLEADVHQSVRKRSKPCQ